MRVTNQQQIDLLLGKIQGIQSELLKVREAVASGKSVSKPSDDAAGFEQITKFRTVLDKIDKRLSSINEGVSRLNLSESALSSATNVLQRAKEIALSQRNATSLGAERTAVAQEVSQLLNTFLDSANTQIDGRFLFSGFETQTSPYALTSVTASGRSPVIEANDNNQGSTSATIAVQTASSLTGQEYKITFTSPTAFDVVNVTSGATVLSNQSYTSGGNIDFDGLRTVLTNNPGGPQTGDEFLIPAHNASDATVAAGLTPTITANNGNTGTGTATASVLTIGSLTGNQYTITFDSPATTFDVVNSTTGATVLNNQAYTSGANIDFDGIRAVISGAPAAGDVFAVDPTDQTVLKPDPYEIRFTSSAAFDVIDLATGQALSTGNTYTSGSNILFAGITTVVTDGTVSPQAGDVFRVRPNYQYQGDTGSIAIEVEDGKTVAINSVGSQVFSGPDVDIFATLQDLHQALVTNTPADLDSIISSLSTGLDQLTNSRTDLGSRANRLDLVSQGLQLLQFTTQSQRSGIEDADLAKVTSLLTALETNYSASLLVLNRQFDVSLLNYLR